MQNEPLKKPSPAPVPKGWKRARRRKQRTFHEDFPTLLGKIRAVLALALYGLSLATFVAGPFTIYVLAYVYGFEWDYDVKATGLILLPVGLVLLALGYGVDPGIARQKKQMDAREQTESLPRDRGRETPYV
jgi:hypothetical protein